MTRRVDGSVNPNGYRGFNQGCFFLHYPVIVPHKTALRGDVNLREPCQEVKCPTIIVYNSKYFLIWISRSFKKGASDNTISYFDQSFWFSGLWLILPRDLGRSGQNKSQRTEREQMIIFFFNFQQYMLYRGRGTVYD